MRQTVLGGALLAVAAALLVLLGESLGLEIEQVALLGAALGAALGLMPDRTPGLRLAGFAVGLGAAWIGYALRAAMLPDSTSGRAVAVLLVIGLCLAVAALSSGRIPLWACLLGVAGLVGAYEETYALTPSKFLDESLTAVTTVLLAAGIGFLASSILGPVVQTRREHEETNQDHEADAESASFDEMLNEQETTR